MNDNSIFNKTGTESSEKITFNNLIKERNKILSKLEIELELESKKIPEGPQRIRGIAGSGKTRLLCQKAAYMHKENPEWRIAYTFFSKSLYDEITRTIDRYLQSFDVIRNPDKLLIMHAWGGETTHGLLGTIRKEHGLGSLTINDSKYEPTFLKFCDVCKKTLEQIDPIIPIFDAILIDEGQDFIIDRSKNPELLYQNRQPFYYLSYSSCKPNSNEKPLQRRLIWTYDEYQNIDSLATPTAEEVFGSEKGFNKLLKGVYPGKTPKNIVMKKSYRTPGPIIIASHAIGMGFFNKPDGMISGPTSVSTWDSLGYGVKGNFKATPSLINLTRPDENSPNPLSSYAKNTNLIKFEYVENRDHEVDLIGNRILDLLKIEELNLSHHIMIICLIGDMIANIKYLSYLGKGLMMKFGISSYMPPMPHKNIFYEPDWRKKNPNKFWDPDAVTITDVRRSKGNEADYVFVVGLHEIGLDHLNVTKRNNLFVAMTRTKGWLHLIGTGEYSIYQEIKKTIECLTETPNNVIFLYHGRQKRVDREEKTDDTFEM